MTASSQSGVRLDDLGERRIISELLAPRYASRAPSFGDDCAQIRLSPGESSAVLVLTTDPCPPPMATQLGFVDWYYRGWLLATINLSDLAAAGAEPIGLLTSLVLPGDTVVSDFERLLDGLGDCCRQSNADVLGGNLKEGPNLEIGATAIGRCCGSPPLTRSGARPGDVVVVLGEVGRFWAGTLALRNGLIDADCGNPLLRPVLTPSPQVAIGAAARNAGLLTACLDNSDGLYSSLAQLGTASGVGVELHSGDVYFADDVREIADRIGVDPLRLALGWGDWQLVGTAAANDVPALRRLAAAEGVPFSTLGKVTKGSGVTLDHDGKRGPLLKLDSERFTKDSWFTAGLDQYIATMLEADLVGLSGARTSHPMPDL
jgi:thiamine-monophosphate kinase